MKKAKIVSFIGVLAMSVVLLYGFFVGDFFDDGADILANPWGIVSLVDLYVGFALFSMWIIYREKQLYKMIIWITLMVLLGFLAGSVYVFLALVQSKGDKEQFFHGYSVN